MCVASAALVANLILAGEAIAAEVADPSQQVKQESSSGNPAVDRAGKPVEADKTNEAAEAAPPPLEEVVVTGRIVSEKLTQSPVAETVFSESDMRDLKIDEPGDFLLLTPNVGFIDSQQSGISFITIRGITQDRNTENPVAVVVDGVLQVDALQFNQAMFDMKRIEVAKGPQGALYGRNAVGGAIIVESNDPTNEWEANLRTSLGDFADREIEGAVSGPLVKDKLLFRVAGRYKETDGFFDNITLGRKQDPLQDVTVRAKLRWFVNDRLTADGRITLSRTDGTANNFQYQPALLDSTETTLDPNNPFPFDFSKISADNVDRKFRSNNIGDDNRDIDEFSLKLTYDLGFATVRSISSYIRINETTRADQFPYTKSLTRFVPGFVFIDGTQTQFFDIDAWSQEVRIISASDQRLRWNAGFYYLTLSRFISSTTGDDRGQGILLVKRTPLFNSAINPTTTFLADNNRNRDVAGFANLSYDVLPDIELSAALRYDRETRRQFVSEFNTAGVPGAKNRANFDKFQPKFTVRWLPDLGIGQLDSLNIYGSWGIGFRSGQFNQNGVGAAAAQIGLNGVKDVIDAEQTSTFEVGFKSRWFGNRLSFEGSFFHTRDTGMPFFAFVGGVGAQILANIDRSELIGGEITTQIKVLNGYWGNTYVGDLEIYAAGGAIDDTIKKFALDPTAIGNRLPHVPHTTLNVGGQYQRKLVANIGFFGRVDFRRIGKTFFDPFDSSVRSVVNLLSFRAGLQDVDAGWSFLFSMDNATNAKFNEEFVLGGFVQPALPQRWTIDLAVSF